MKTTKYKGLFIRTRTDEQDNSTHKIQGVVLLNKKDTLPLAGSRFATIVDAEKWAMKFIDDRYKIDEQPKTLKQINQALYYVLCDMLASRKGHDENGQIEFKQNDLDSMEDTYARIQICYLLEDADGSREEEMYEEFVEEGSVPMTDEEAYVELTVRLNNTRIY